MTSFTLVSFHYTCQEDTRNLDEISKYTTGKAFQEKLIEFLNMSISWFSKLWFNLSLLGWHSFSTKLKKHMSRQEVIFERKHIIIDYSYSCCIPSSFCLLLCSVVLNISLKVNLRSASFFKTSLLSTFRSLHKLKLQDSLHIEILSL
jgi:hypothetical protein